MSKVQTIDASGYTSGAGGDGVEISVINIFTVSYFTAILTSAYL
jgi:hypothetical protein